jgi:DNA-binding YbaB/EbfC family protein
MNQQQMMKLRKMQKQMMEAQEKLEQTVFTGTAGGGVVTAEVKGNHEVVAIHIDPEAMDDKDMVEDMVVLAINDAGKKIDAESNKLLGGFGGGLGGFGF